MLAYFTVEEVAQKSGLNGDQVLRLGMSGTLAFSVLEHAPKNYEEVSELESEGGRTIVRTKKNETLVFASGNGPALKLKYIGPEDVINVVTNDAPNRKTLVRALYETRERDPKKGKWFENNPWRVSLDDLVVSSEEWELFSKGEGKKLKQYLPLPTPEKVTLPWLFKNLPVGTWMLIAGIAFSIFSSGVYFSKTQLYQEITQTLEPASVQKSEPNQ